MTDWHDSVNDYMVGGQVHYGLAERSAGHSWHEDTHGRVCKWCGRRWAEVVGATEEAINQKHWAHVDHLAPFEQKELKADADWLWTTIVDAASAGK